MSFTYRNIHMIIVSLKTLWKLALDFVELPSFTFAAKPQFQLMVEGGQVKRSEKICFLFVCSVLLTVHLVVGVRKGHFQVEGLSWC